MEYILIAATLPLLATTAVFGWLWWRERRGSRFMTGAQVDLLKQARQTELDLKAKHGSEVKQMQTVLDNTRNERDTTAGRLVEASGQIKMLMEECTEWREIKYGHRNWVRVTGITRHGSMEYVYSPSCKECAEGAFPVRIISPRADLFPAPETPVVVTNTTDTIETAGTIIHVGDHRDGGFWVDNCPACVAGYMLVKA